MTGIASGKVETLDMKRAARIVKTENKRVAELIGIKPAARTTCVKPAGTTSLTLGTSSGIHPWHASHYIRRMRVGKNEAIYTHLQIYHPELVEDEFFRPHDTAIISVPQKAPKGSTTRSELSIDLLERVKHVSNSWVRPGHSRGQNTHNVSATVTVREENWDGIAEWMWQNKSYYNGLSVLPYSEHNYRQAPFEDCTREEYEKLFSALQELDVTKIVEIEDNTNLRGELACSGGACEII